METIRVQSRSRWRWNPISAISAGDVQFAQVFVQLGPIVLLHLIATLLTATVQLFQLVLLMLLRLMPQRKASSLRCVDLDIARVFVSDERNALRCHVVNRRRQRHIPIVPERVMMAPGFDSGRRITTTHSMVDHLRDLVPHPTVLRTSGRAVMDLEQILE